MNTRIVLSALAGVMLMGTAFAADTGQMYISKSGEKWMFHGANGPAAGTEILKSEAGAKPANCPDGSYWLNDKQMLASCTGTDVLGFAKIPAGQKTAAGQAFPADSYIVQQGGMSMTDVSK